MTQNETNGHRVVLCASCGKPLSSKRDSERQQFCSRYCREEARAGSA